MKAEKVLKIVNREMCAYGDGWRADWSDFDGRTLRSQLDSVASWSVKALASEVDIDLTSGTEFCDNVGKY